MAKAKRLRIDVPTITGQLGIGAAEVWGKKHNYTTGKLLAATAVADSYLCDYNDESGTPVRGVLKVTRDPEDNDIGRKEATVIAYLRERLAEDANALKYMPVLVDHFDLQSLDSGKRSASVFPYSPNVYSVAEIVEANPAGLDPRDTAWMLNRAMEAMYFVHSRGIYHGALLPPNFLLDISTHGGTLIEWGYASTDGTALTAIDGGYEAWYPPSVAAKEKTTPAMDIFMFGRLGIALLGGDPLSGSMPSTVPSEIAGLLRYCLHAKNWASKDPKAAMKLHEEFGQVLHDLYGKRAFRPFHMPARA